MENKYLSKENCTMMRGIVAIVIIMHHISSYVSFGRAIDFILKNIGASMATVFFFYSGYGLLLNVLKKKNYMDDFLKKRLSAIAIPYIIANVAYIVFRIATGTMKPLSFFVEKLLEGYVELVTYSWYVLVIFLMYILFYISFKWSEVKKGLILCVALNVIYIFLMYVIGFGEWWYNTAFAFSFGMFYAFCFDKADAFLKKNAIVKFLIASGIFGALLIGGKLIDIELVVILIKMCRTVVFSILVLYFSMLFKKKNKLFSFIGSISFEIYLYQGIAIALIMNTVLKKSPIGASAVTILLTILLAVVFNKINNFILKIVCK